MTLSFKKKKKLLYSLWLYILMGMVLGFTSCNKYKCNERIEGVYYPNGTVSMWGLTDDMSGAEAVDITVSEPIRVSELGTWTYGSGWRNAPIGTTAQVAKLEFPDKPKLVYVDFLYKTGRFEYHEPTLIDRFLHPSFTDILIAIGIAGIFLISTRLIYKLIQKKRELVEMEAEKLRQRKVEEEELRKLKEIDLRNGIVLNITNNLYKETQREVNKTLIPTLINELNDVYIGLHSDNLKELIINGSSTDFQNVMESIKAELERLKKLAFDAQKNGYTDEERGYDQSNDDNEMTKGKACKILAINLNASKEEIKKAYRDLAKKYNTDQRAHYDDHVKQMLEEKMKEINEAKEYFLNLGIL